MFVTFVVLLVDNGCRAFVLPTTNSRASACFLNNIGSSSYGIASLSISSASLSSSSRLFSTPDNEDDSTPDQEGASMAAQFFQMAQAKGVTLDDDDLLDDEDDDNDDDEDYEVENTVDDDDDDDDDEEPNIPQGAVDAFLDKKLTDDRLYSEVKERVLDTAGGFVDMVRGPSDDDDDDDEYGNDTNKPYSPPMVVPDSELTAGEVVLLVLDALKNNDNPTVNKGVDILFGYSSSGSQIKNEEGLTPKEYGEFLKETEYKALFEHINVVSFK
jgi:hypothetical protein